MFKDLGRNQEALSDYNKVIEINPKDSDAYNNRGYYYFIYE